MNIENVIEKGKIASQEIEISIFLLPTWFWWVAAIVLIISILSLFSGIENFVIIIPIWMVIVIGVFFVNDYKEQKIVNEKINLWKEEVAKPFIEALPIENKEIVFIKIDPELSHEVEGSSYWGSGYTKSTEIQRTPLVVSFKDNGITTLTDWYETNMELTESNSPYIEFQRLTKGLGNGIDKGFYNIKVNLPESYKFTDIK